jgi:hypothetical protein
MPQVHDWNSRTINNQWRYNVLGRKLGERLNTRTFNTAIAGSVAIIQLHRRLPARVCARLRPSWESYASVFESNRFAVAFSDLDTPKICSCLQFFDNKILLIT